jgi:hypothetical protein
MTEFLNSSFVTRPSSLVLRHSSFVISFYTTNISTRLTTMA